MNKTVKKINWNFVFSFIVFQAPMYVLMIIAYYLKSFAYNWYVIAFIVFFGVILNINLRRIDKLEKQIKKLEEDK